MTNAEKYLKDGVDISQLASELTEECYSLPESCNLEDIIVDFFNDEAINNEPTLTEDERVILRNIDKKFYKIGRANDNTIYFVFEEFTGKEIKYYANVFDNIFQFIKERRRI